MNSKIIQLHPSNVVENVNSFLYINNPPIISLEMMANDENMVSYATTNISGDLPISSSSMQVLPGLTGKFATVSWGEGFAIHNISDQGIINTIYYDSAPIAGRIYYQSMAIHSGNSVFVGDYTTTNMAKYDISNLYAGGTSIVKSTIVPTTTGYPVGAPGGTYFNGLAVVGDYLYLSSYNSTSTYVQHRYNLLTNTGELITIINQRNAMSRCNLIYEESKDRLWGFSNNGGEISVVLNASHSLNDAVRPTGYAIRTYTDRSLSTTIRGGGFIPLSENIYWFVYAYCNTCLDISPCIVGAGANPTVVNYTKYEYAGIGDRTYRFFEPRYLPYYDKYINYTVPHQEGRSLAWVDTGNGSLVCPNYDYISTAYELYYNTDHDLLHYGYAPYPIRVVSTGGIPYWIYGGYSYDGGRFRTYHDSTGCAIHRTGYITFGPYTLDNTGLISHIVIENLTGYTKVPSECSLNYYVSNNNGSTYELFNYASETIHEFNSMGAQARLKIEMSGNCVTAPYIQGTYTLPSFSLIEKPLTSEYAKSISFRLKGKN